MSLLSRRSAPELSDSQTTSATTNAISRLRFEDTIVTGQGHKCDSTLLAFSVAYGVAVTRKTRTAGRHVSVTCA
jgi:hypothetical protein